MLAKKILLTALILAIVSGGLFVVMRGSGNVSSGKVNVVASFYPLYDFAKHVGGDKVQVTNVTPAGAEPHDYEPSPKMLAAARASEVFIFNGEWLEPWTSKFLRDRDYAGTTVMGGSGISLRKGNDPHYWLDPVDAQQIVNNIRDGLSEADPNNSGYYAARANAYNAQLAQLDDEFKHGLAQCEQHTVISSHQAFGYIAARYDFSVEAIAGLSPEEEPSAERLAALSNIIKQDGIHYVFFESLVSPRLADTIAAETGAKTLVFDPIEGLSDAAQKQGKDYLSVQRENLRSLRIALACK
ncbi:MAG TPA: zinc ABC transporter substrate-binding protein [Candidatus Saccharimonadales bacterium]